MNFLGIDPGAVHTGVAFFRVRPRERVGQSLLIENASLCELGERLIFYIQRYRVDVVISEDFAIRSTGFNSFDRGATLRRLGVIEYIARSQGCTHFTVPASSPERAYLLWPSVSHNAPIFRLSTHSTSAWRVIGEHLLHVGMHDTLDKYTGATL